MRVFNIIRERGSLVLLLLLLMLHLLEKLLLLNSVLRVELLEILVVKLFSYAYAELVCFHLVLLLKELRVVLMLSLTHLLVEEGKLIRSDGTLLFLDH